MFQPAKYRVDLVFDLSVATNGQWQINVFLSQVNNRSLAKPQRGAIEVWQLGTKVELIHPIHIHLIPSK